MDTQKPKQAEIIVIVTPEQRKLVDTRHSHTDRREIVTSYKMLVDALIITVKPKIMGTH